MAVNKYIIQLIVETGEGTAKVKGVSKAFEDLENKVQKVVPALEKAKKATDGMGGAAGIAGATAAELGRTISDLPYGIQAVTNNVSQLGSMFSLLVSSSNGVDGAFKNLGKVLSGPAGTLILFQSAVAAVDFFSQALSRNQREAKKEADELKNINEELEKQETLLMSSARTAFLYAKDITAALGTNVKEVSNYLAEIRKEGPITEEVFNKAIESGRKLLEARKESNIIEKEIIKTEERLNELGGLNADKEDIRLAAVKEHNLANQTYMSILTPKMSLEQAMQDILDKRKDVLGNLNFLSLKQTEANEKESEALKVLNYQATEEIVVTGKLKKAKEEVIEARYSNINAMIREALSSVNSFRNAYIDRRVFQQREKLDDIEFLEWKADFFDRLSKDSSFSYEEQTRFYAQYVASTEQLGDIQLRNEMIKLNAMENINMSYADSLGTIFDTIAGLAGENRFLQAVALIGESAVGIAKIIISTKAANMAARLKYALIPGGQALAAAEIAANNFGAKVGIGANIAATATALSELKAPASAPSSPSIGSDNSTGLPNESAPAFNVVGSSSSQLAQIMAAQGRAPVKAYVVAGEVSTAQSLERNRVKEASI